MILVMAMEQGQPRVVGDEVDLDWPTRGMLIDADRWRLPLSEKIAAQRVCGDVFAATQLRFDCRPLLEERYSD
jgi:hypothetical protein